MLDLKSIREETDSRTYTKGTQLYLQGMVGDLTISELGNLIEGTANVEGSYGNEYFVAVTFDRKNNYFQDYYCECPAYSTYAGMCKHCAAVAMEMVEWWNRKYIPQMTPLRQQNAVPKIRRRQTDSRINSLMHQSALRENDGSLQKEYRGNVELEPYLHKNGEIWSVDFKIGARKKYVVKDLGNLVKKIHNGEWETYGKNLAFYHSRNAFTPESRKILDFIESCVFEEVNANEELIALQYGYRADQEIKTVKVSRNLYLTRERMIRFAEMMEGKTCSAEENNKFTGKQSMTMEFMRKDPVLLVSLKEDQSGDFNLTLPKADVYEGRNGLCILMGSQAFLCSQEFRDHMVPVARLIDSLQEMEYHIHADDMSSFCASVVPDLEDYAVFKKPDNLETYMPKPCDISYYLDLEEGNLIAKIRAAYGEKTYELGTDYENEELFRDRIKEQKAVELLQAYDSRFDEQKNRFVIDREEEAAIFRFLDTGIGNLQEAGEVYVSEALKRLQLLKPPKITVGVSLESGLLDIDIDSGFLPPDELAALLASYRRRKKYYRLKNGSFLKLGDTSLEAVAELAEGLGLTAEQIKDGSITVPEYRSFYLDQVLRENETGLEIKRDHNFKAMIRDMKNVEDSDFAVPEGLNASLRPYQKLGYRWLKTLDKLGFGGILADDMGLGKTVQTIALLLAEKEESQSLIVCPASLVYNWESEIRRFAPSLKVQTVVGNAELRKEKIHSADIDVLLTSYDLLKRDVLQYEGKTFTYLILDEAQNIKNHVTQAAKAVKSISSIRRFALTGTPIENSLSELWSIFDFLMPGFLGTYKSFKEQYEQPIVSKADDVVSGRLKKMVKPFILRRLKKEVLKELPDKLEEVVYSGMDDAQREIYLANVQHMLEMIGQQSQADFSKGRLQILAQLTRLRQICCDPSLVYENYTGGAAKVDTCMDLITAAAESGSQILVFSQFTSMLEIIRKRLEQEKLAYYILTGETSKEKRKELVEAFNKDHTPVFLISLKAGGTGLNLTAASVVIHVDPWWNQAAQNQATDRAHRIGQEQVVTVYKLIMKDTIEEKILKLQEKKAQLSDEIITEGSMGEMFGSREEFMEMFRDAAGQIGE